MRCTSISDGKNLIVELLDFGARVHRIKVNETEVALSYPELNDYLTDPYYLGASVGPIANRIADGQLSIGNTRYQMPRNEGNNCLHSGGLGFDQQIWQLIDATQSSAEYQLIFDMKRVGMDGYLTVNARYQTVDDCLSIEYRAISDTDTYINLTNHVYLNLAGAGNINDHQFQVHAKDCVLVDEQSLPTGELKQIDSPLNYQLLNSSEAEFVDLIDHHFNTANDGKDNIVPMLNAYSKTTGIGVKISGNSPGFQFYTGKFLDTPFEPSAGFCLESQFAPNAINQANFYSPVLGAGDVKHKNAHKQHQQLTRFEFSY